MQHVIYDEDFNFVAVLELASIGVFLPETHYVRVYLPTLSSTESANAETPRYVRLKAGYVLFEDLNRRILLTPTADTIRVQLLSKAQFMASITS